MDLVTGATGFIGKALTISLLARGRRVRSVVRSPEKARSLKDAGLEVIVGDLRDMSILPRALEGVERVFHLAGITKALSGNQYWEGNVDVTLGLARAFSIYGKGRLVLVSSLAAAGPSVPKEPRIERIPSAPVSLYGRSKLKGEEAVTSLPEPLSWTVIRPPIVYGPGDRDVLLMFKGAARGWVPLVDPDQVCSLIHVDDLVEALILAGSRPEAHRQTFYVAGSPDLTAGEMVALAGLACGRQARIKKIPAWLCHTICAISHFWSFLRGRPGILSLDKAREMFQPAWHCSSAKIGETLGWAAEIPHEEGFRQTVSWYREQGLMDK